MNKKLDAKYAVETHATEQSQLMSNTNIVESRYVKDVTNYNVLTAVQPVLTNYENL